ncbi:MAG: hypothetical protein SO415_03595 [Oliverpabstia sp.]|nr:hypothetical protein [Oliverpabstia sp.]
MGHYKKRPFPMAAGIFMILAAILVLSGCGKDNKKDIVFYFNEDSVTKDEYEMLAKEYSNQIYRKYSTEQVNQEDFWTKEIDGQKPYELLDEIVTEKLLENYNLKTIAVEEKIVKDYNYQELMEQRDKENQEKKKGVQEGDVIYGLTSFDDSAYYEYWYSNLETQIKNQWIKENVKVTRGECQTYYDTHREDFSYDIGVTVLYAEIGFSSEEEKETAWKTAEVLGKEMKEENPEKLLKKYPNIYLEKLELNSLETQEGKSGVYTQRWEIASQLSNGQVCQPYEQTNSICLMKCIKRIENGSIEFEKMESEIERYLQMQEAENYINREKEKIKVKKGTISSETIISQLKK